ncbi:MAG: YbbR-like domain-containing protein [Spirochaetales bacterium]|nr:YbbR-like domain-containing protein [Spirochaetales bacterium]
MRIKNLGKSIFTNWPAKIISLLVAVIIFFIYRMDTQQQFSIPLEKKLPPGFAIANEYPSRVDVVLRGVKYRTPLEESNFYAFFDVSNIRTEGQVQAEIIVKLLPEDLKLGTFEFEYSPSLISIRLEQEIEKKVPVLPNLVGAPPKGYKYEYKIDPGTITIRGPRSHVQKITEVTTEKIDLTGRISEIKSFVKITTGNSFVRPLENQEALLQISINQEQITKTFSNIPIILTNTPFGLQVMSAIPRGYVELKGNQIDIDNLDTEQIKLIVNCREVTEPGEYVFIPEPNIPEKMSVINYDPKTIIIKFGLR